MSRWAENRKIHSGVVVKMQTVGLLTSSSGSFYCPFMVVSHGILFFFLIPFLGGFLSFVDYPTK